MLFRPFKVYIFLLRFTRKVDLAMFVPIWVCPYERLDLKNYIS